MKKLFTLLLVCLFFACTDEQSADLGDSATFVKMYGGPHGDIAYLAKQTPDDGFILLGTTEIEVGTSSIFKIRLVKTDKFGNTEWEQLYPAEFDEPAYSLKGRSLIIMDDGYLVVGDRINRTNGVNELVSSLNFLKVDLTGTEDGNTSKNYPLLNDLIPPDTIGSLQGFDVIQDVDGNLVVLSAMQDNTNTNNDMLLSKFNSNLTGSILCGDSIAGDFAVNGLPAIAKSLYQNASTSQIVVGGTSDIKGNPDFRIITFNDCQSNPSSGGAFNTNGTGTYIASQVIPYGDLYAVVGTTDAHPDGTDDNMFIAITDGNGVPLANRTHFIYDLPAELPLEQDEEGRTIAATADGGFIIAGSSLSNSRGEIDILVVKTDAFGGVQWSIRLGDTNEEYATHVEQTSDGGYIIFGNTEFGGIDTMVLTKISKNGELN